jgi:putative flippase GtrA
MATETRTIQKKPFIDRVRPHVVFYGDMTIRSLASFLAIVILFGILSIFIDLPLWARLSIAFVIGIGFSPLFNKITLADRILSKYEKFLNKVFKLNMRDN